MVDDRVWELIAPLLPPPASARGPNGRPRIGDRAALEGIQFVLHTGCQWRNLPVELGYGSAGRSVATDRHRPSKAASSSSYRMVNHQEKGQQRQIRL